jgi:hypothetical protein
MPMLPTGFSWLLTFGGSAPVTTTRAPVADVVLRDQHGLG